MPRVMTWNELEKQKKIQPEVKEQKARESLAPAPKALAPARRYYLYSPEFYDDFEDSVVFDGKSHRRVCKNGVIHVESEKVKDFLVSKGFQLLRSEAI